MPISMLVFLGTILQVEGYFCIEKAV